VLPCEQAEGGGLSSDAAEAVLAEAEGCTSMVIGPGLGTDASTSELLGTLLPRLEAPVVLDADGLNLLAEAGVEMLSVRKAPTVLTPPRASSRAWPALSAPLPRSACLCGAGRQPRHGHPGHGRRDRRQQHPVRGGPEDRRAHRDRGQPARLAQFALASKATGFPIAKMAALLAVGYSLDEIPNTITKKRLTCGTCCRP